MSKLFIVFLICPLFVSSQRKKERDTSTIILQPDRIEFEKCRESSEFYVVSGSEKGILIVEETLEVAKEGGFQWKMHIVDTAFQVIWSQISVVPVDGVLIGYEYFGGTFYLLFSTNRYRSEDLLVYQISADSQECISYEITTVFPMEISYFESVGDILLLAGYTNFRPVVITYNINDRIPRVIPGMYDTKNDILDLRVDNDLKLFSVILSEKRRNKKTTIRIKTFTDRGDLIQDNLVDPGDRINLIDGASTTFSGGLQYLAGTYSKKSLQYSQGLYLSKFINGQKHFDKYYPFADLNNFWDHLPPKREERIKKRIKKKREKGKIKKFNYRLLVHEIIERDDEYIMVAEAYYPRYNYSSPGSSFSSYTDFSNSGFYNPYFLGYKYTHAVVVGFDVNCNIIWDHTFKIEDIQTYSLGKNVVVSVSGDHFFLMYLEGNEIRSKVFEEDEIVEERTFNPVKLSYETDQVKNRNPSIEKIEKWYGKTLFAYGEQSIHNENGVRGKTNRKVFYLNKIQYNLDRQVN